MFASGILSITTYLDPFLSVVALVEPFVRVFFESYTMSNGPIVEMFSLWPRGGWLILCQVSS